MPDLGGRSRSGRCRSRWANYLSITIRMPIDGGIPGELLFCRLCPDRLTERGRGAGLDQLNTPGDRQYNRFNLARGPCAGACVTARCLPVIACRHAVISAKMFVQRRCIA